MPPRFDVAILTATDPKPYFDEWIKICAEAGSKWKSKEDTQISRHMLGVLKNYAEQYGYDLVPKEN